jgi:putative ABC transport system substrate-binding protein
MISRRNALAGVTALASCAWLGAGTAQRMYRIAVLVHGLERTQGARVEALRTGLREHGYVEGKNLSLSVRWNEGGLERLPDLAAELLRGKPDVLAAGPVVSAAAAQKQTRAVPIVIMWGAGAVKVGLAKSYARPGGNVTGLEAQNEDLSPKHMELLKTIAPGTSRLGVLNTGTNLFHEEAWQAATQAAQALKIALIDVRLGVMEDIARVPEICGKGACDGLYVMPDPLISNWRSQIIEQAAKLRLPAVYFQPEFVLEGGLLSYSANIEDMCRRAAGHIDKILKGAKPAELPIERPSKFELVINLKTARALGLTIPDAVLARADRLVK